MATIFLSYSVAPADGPVVSRVKSIAVVSGHTVTMPPRQHPPGSPLATIAMRQAVLASDVVLALASVGGPQHDWLNREVQTAFENQKPVVALLEAQIAPQATFPPGVPVVPFDRHTPYQAQAAIQNAVQVVGDAALPQQEGGGLGQLVGGLLLAGLAFWALSRD